MSGALCGLAKTTDGRVTDHGIIRNSMKGVMKTRGDLRRVHRDCKELHFVYSLRNKFSHINHNYGCRGGTPLIK